MDSVFLICSIFVLLGGIIYDSERQRLAVLGVQMDESTELLLTTFSLSIVFGSTVYFMAAFLKEFSSSLSFYYFMTKKESSRKKKLNSVLRKKEDRDSQLEMSLYQTALRKSVAGDNAVSEFSNPMSDLKTISEMGRAKATTHVDRRHRKSLLMKTNSQGSFRRPSKIV